MFFRKKQLLSAMCLFFHFVANVSFQPFFTKHKDTKNPKKQQEDFPCRKTLLKNNFP